MRYTFQAWFNKASNFQIRDFLQKGTGRKGWCIWFWRFYILIAPKTAK